MGTQALLHAGHTARQPSLQGTHQQPRQNLKKHPQGRIKAAEACKLGKMVNVPEIQATQDDVVHLYSLDKFLPGVRSMWTLVGQVLQLRLHAALSPARWQERCVALI